MVEPRLALTAALAEVHIGPSFDGDAPEEERQHVSRHLLPAYERDGWELTGPVERMYRLLRPIMIPPRHRAIARVSEISKGLGFTIRF